MIQIGVLGDLTVANESGTVELHQPKLQALLCSLVVDAGEYVSIEVLEDRLWGHDRPATSRKLVHTYVSKLRTLWGSDGDEAITTSGPRYRLSSAATDIDARRFESDALAGSRALESGRYDDAESLLRGALDLWRGRAFADVAWAAWAQPEAVRLEEERMMAWERRIEADLCRGRHIDVIPELTELVLVHPLREPLCAHLMVALYRSNRQAEALRVFRSLRKRLVDELGIEPSDRLFGVEASVLGHDPELLRPCR